MIATITAVFFHLVGLVGILFFNRDFFVNTTSLNLLLMLVLLFYTQERVNISFVIFFISCFITGMLVEYIGTTTGYLFGDYAYGEVLGISVKNVPLIIGVNWFIVMYCCGNAMHLLLNRLISRIDETAEKPRQSLQTIALVTDAATLAVIFDWLMEPVAVNLGYWKWGGTGEIPLFNYASWFMVSMVLLYLFRKLDFVKGNKFAVNLLLIQAMFFLLLRTFL